MRIAHVITRMILGGAQENTLLTCRELKERYGDEVRLITGPALGPEGSLLDEARGRGIAVEIVPTLRRAINPALDLTAYVHLRRSLADFQPDVVHTHSAKAGILGRAAASACGVPMIVHTVHGAPWHPYQSRLAQKCIQSCERWAARRCHRLISVADAMTEQMVAAAAAPREKFTTIYSGMDVEPFLAASELREATRAALGYGPHEVVVGKVARLFHLKGHEFLIQAAQRAVERAPDVPLRFLLVGDGILRPALQRQIDQAGLVRFFHFTGLVPPGKIPALLAATDLVVHTSLREGLARVLPQAMLAARPVVSYDIDGAREVVRPGQTGVLLPPCSVEPLSDAIVTLAQDANERRRLGAAGRELARQRFRYQDMVARIREVYRQTTSVAGLGGTQQE